MRIKQMLLFTSLNLLLLLLFTHITKSNELEWKRPGCHKIIHTRNVTIDRSCLIATITTVSCRGFCDSWSLPSIITGFKRQPITSLAQCCNIMDFEDIAVTVKCINKYGRLYDKTVYFKSALSCECYHCKKD